MVDIPSIRACLIPSPTLTWPQFGLQNLAGPPRPRGDIRPQRRVTAVLVTSGDVWNKNQQHWFLGMRIIVRKVGWFYVWGLFAMCVFNFLLLMGSCVLICSTCRNDWEVLQDFLSLVVFRAQHTSWLASCPSAGNQQAALGFPNIHDLNLQIESHILKRWCDEMFFSKFHTPPTTPLPSPKTNSLLLKIGYSKRKWIIWLNYWFSERVGPVLI